MATYRAIQQEVKLAYGFTPKACWIADVLFEHGLVNRSAPNRKDASVRIEPCLEDKRSGIEAAIDRLG